MKVKLLRQNRIDGAAGEIVEVSPARAAFLFEYGLAKPVKERDLNGKNGKARETPEDGLQAEDPENRKTAETPEDGKTAETPEKAVKGAKSTRKKA